MKDITGERFGRTIALEPTIHRKQGSVVWKCICDCGKIYYIEKTQLKHNKINSCGCYRKELSQEMGKSQTKVSIGNRYGRLVIKRIFKDSGVLRCECVCDCGKVVVRVSGNLLSGGTRSCGCLHKDILKKRTKGLSLGYTAAMNRVYRYYTFSAQKRNLSFKLSKSYFFQMCTSVCHYCGAKPFNISKNKSSDFIYNGIDRKNNDLGYTKDNCVSCCKLCNQAKHIMGEQEFQNWAKRLSMFTWVKTENV